MNSTKTTLPQQSILHESPRKWHYMDSFQGHFKEKGSKASPTDVGKAFFLSAPAWVEKLFYVRNKMVAAFGLKTSESSRQRQLDNFKCEKGEQMGLFKVFDKNEREVILGEDDKHLDFRVSLFLGESNVKTSERDLTISTTVFFHNRWGRLYFLPVKPLHRLIVPSMLKGIIRKLEEREV